MVWEMPLAGWGFKGGKVGVLDYKRLCQYT